MRFQGKVALISAAGAGIGRATAMIIGREGGTVVGVDVEQGALDRLSAEVGTAGGRALGLRADALDAASVADVVRRALDAFGRIDILVNAVGGSTIVSRPAALLDELTLEEWQRLLHFNLTGTFLLTHAVVPVMKRQRSGKIINISSSTVFAGTPLFLHYVASKAALVGMTRSLAREVGEFGICVNAIAPGLVQHEGQNAPREFTEFQLKARSLKRLQTPEDLLGVLVYLASSDSDFVTGQTLLIDGGNVLY